MAFTTKVKNLTNEVLAHLNLRLDTLTAFRCETRRLEALRQSGHFERPVFPVPSGFSSTQVDRILAAIDRYRDRFSSFADSATNEAGYTFDNIYFTSPDAEVFYSIVREWQPSRIIEIGSGNSTKVARQAIRDARLNTRLISIDPQPRLDVEELADEWYRSPVEATFGVDRFSELRENDILFIDSSHTIRAGNDVVFLYLNVLPSLPAGVLVHIHDIFLPFDYPEQWVIENRYDFTEQYLVQCLLMDTSSYEVLWAGYHHQKTVPNFEAHFPHLNGRSAKSLWLRKTCHGRFAAGP